MRRSLILFGLLAASCGGPPAQGQVDAIRLQVPTATPRAPAAIPSTATMNVTPLRLEEEGCRAETRAIYRSSSEGLRLCDRGLTKCFLEVDDIQASPMQLSIGMGEAPLGLLEVPFRGLRVWGFVPTATIRVFPRVATRLGGFFHATYVHPIEGMSGALKVRADASSKVHTAATLETALACDELAFSEDYVSGEEIARRVGATGTEQAARLKPGLVPVSTSPGLAPIATIEAGVDEGVSLYQSKRGFRFAVFWTESGQVFGWIPQSSALPVGIGSLWGSSGGGKGFAPTPTDWLGRRCKHAVPILAQVGDEIFEVGTLPSGIVFSVGAYLSKDLDELELHYERYSDGGNPPTLRTPEVIRVLSGAKLGVARRAVERCERGVAGEPRSR